MSSQRWIVTLSFVLACPLLGCAVAGSMEPALQPADGAPPPTPDAGGGDGIDAEPGGAGGSSGTGGSGTDPSDAGAGPRDGSGGMRPDAGMAGQGGPTSAGSADGTAEAPDAAVADDGAAPPDASAGSDPDARVESDSGVDAAGTDRPDATPADDSGTVEVACMGGSYTGTFEGSLAIRSGRLEVDLPEVSGTFKLFASRAPDGLSLNVETGTLSSTNDPDNTVYVRRVTGQIDCQTGRLMYGRLMDGLYTRSGGGSDSVGFQGQLEGTYEVSDAARLAGGWTTTGPEVTGGGEFRVTFRPD